MELYNDLKALQADGLIVVDNDAEEDKTRITLTDPERAASLLEEEAKKDDTRLAALEKAGEETETAADPAMSRLLKRRAETLETLRADAATILDSYGNLDHSALLKTVYEKYPAYAKNSRVGKARKSNSGK
jgi:type I restriction enzyme S subunit